jgi:carbonic anhydrase
MNPERALQRLLEGNRRFAADTPIHPHRNATRRMQVSQAQEPFAVVLGCSDSRVPPELVFDCGLGDLFVFRTAGHVVDMAVIGSIAYGLDILGVPLLMVLGHTSCGAVQAAIDMIEGTNNPDKEIGRLVDIVRPAADRAAEMDGDLWLNAVQANVEQTVAQIKRNTRFSRAILQDRLRIVGAVYDLSTGVVELIC